MTRRTRTSGPFALRGRELSTNQPFLTRRRINVAGEPAADARPIDQLWLADSSILDIGSEESGEISAVLCGDARIVVRHRLVNLECVEGNHTRAHSS